MLVYVLLTLTAFAQPSLVTLKTFENALVAQIDQSVEAGTGYRPLLANFLRLAFHDCVGTCDGCINMENPHHLGLQLSLDVLGPMVDQWKEETQLSRADLFAFAGFTAAKYAFGPGEVVDFDYAYGREDCEVTLGLAGEDFDYATQDSAANEVEILPDSHDSPYEFMTERFGFTDTMTTAIMGVHVLGRMSLENSGHSGLWVNTPCELDGEFYREMINVPWDQEASVSQTFGTRQQWGRNGGGNNNKFLNSDMALIVDFEHTEGVVNDANCRNDHRNCPEASTLGVAESFRDDATFVAAFKNAFLSMISNGFSLTTVCEEVECDMAFRTITAMNAQFCGENVNNGKGKGPGPDKGNGPPPPQGGAPPQGGQNGGKGPGKGRGRRLLRN
jgi:hypothetical protein